MTPLLSSLREPPVVGRFYMVPVVRDYPWCGRKGNWPVLGPLHDDKQFFSFAQPHYHIDCRFTDARQDAFMARQGSARHWQDLASEVVAIAALSYPLATRWHDLPKGMPTLARRRCIRASYHCPAAAPSISKMREALGDPAEPLRLADGRLLCPHRKVDLSQFPPDENGIVTCPLHGLRVRCGA